MKSKHQGIIKTIFIIILALVIGGVLGWGIFHFNQKEPQTIFPLSRMKIGCALMEDNINRYMEYGIWTDTEKMESEEFCNALEQEIEHEKEWLR